MTDAATPEQIQEYELQLANIEQLLEADPKDESLLGLKRDIEELLELSRSNLPSASETTPASAELNPSPLPPQPNEIGAKETAELDAATAAVSTGAVAAASTSDDVANAKAKKKKQKLKDFVLPPHLVPNEADSEAEKNRKRRAAKKLKNKWREKKKELESNNRQASWQSFQKKSKRKDTSSIFSTREGEKEMTQFGARKRHKHS